MKKGWLRFQWRKRRARSPPAEGGSLRHPYPCFLPVSLTFAPHPDVAAAGCVSAVAECLSHQLLPPPPDAGALYDPAPAEPAAPAAATPPAAAAAAPPANQGADDDGT